MDEKITRHESFGMVRISRVTGGKRSLCGSSIQHSNTIRLSVNTAAESRDLHRTHYFSKDPIVEIEMSPTQFVDAITNLNTSGVPVTIIRKGIQSMEKCPSTHIREIFEEEFKEDIASVLKNTNKMMKHVESTLLKTGTITKKERKELANILYTVEQDIRANMPFVQKQFNKQIDRSVTEAKGEIDAFFTSVIHRLGSQKLVEELESGALSLPINTEVE